MAYTLQLTNRKSPATVLNLIGQTYDVQRDKLSLGTARVARVLTESLLRQGFNISAHTHVRRQMSFRLTISADSDENLAAAIQKLNDTLRRTREFSISGSEEQWWLQFNPTTGINSVFFAVKDGRLELPPPNYNKSRWELDRPFVIGDLDLITDPLGEGDPISISATLMRNDPTRTSAPINYYTIASSVIKGDQLAKLKLKIIEQQAMTKLWVGAEYGPTYNDPDDLILTANDFNRDASGVAFSGNQVTGQSNIWSPNYVRRIQGVPNYEGNPARALTGSNVGFTSSQSRNYTFNNSSNKANQILIVAFISLHSTSAKYSVSYNGISLKQVPKETLSFKISLFYLVNPSKGSNTITITRFDNTGSTKQIHRVLAFILDGINQNKPFLDNVIYKNSNGRYSLSDFTNGNINLTNKRNPLLTVNIGTNTLSLTPLSNNLTIFNSTGAGAFITYVRNNDINTLSVGSTQPPTHSSIGLALNAANSDSPQIIETSSFSIKKGTYRVFAKLTGNFLPNSFRKAGIGYRYGNYIVDPKTGFDFTSLDNLIDIGTIVMPPISAPKESEVANIRLRFNYFSNALANTQANNSGVLLDALYLLKVDEGSASVKKIEASQDTIDIDTTIDPPSAIVLDRSTNVFKSRPEQSGAMIYVNPNGTRIYLLGDDEDKTNTWVLSGTIIPQYLHVA